MLLLLVVSLGCAFYASLAWYGFDLLEEGYFLTHARRVQLGGLPYRDFSTPYTPGVFYLYAWMMEALGADLLALRVLSVLARAVTFAGLYLCARRLMSPAFAAIAPLVLVVMDTAPELWGIHPGWFTSAAATLAVLAVARYMDTGRWGWLVAAGALSGVSFAFKQNLAAYGLIAALWFLVVAERRLPPLGVPWKLPVLSRRLDLALRLAVQVAALVLLPLTAAVIVRPYFSALVGTLFVLPLLVLSAVAAARILPHPAAPFSPGFLARPLLVLAGFGAVTLPWLVALIVALDWRIDLLGGFVGQIDPTGYYFGMKPYSTEHARLVGAALLPALIVFAVARAGLWGWRGASAVLALLLLGSAAAMSATGHEAGQEPWSHLGWIQGRLLAIGSVWQDYGRTTRPTDDLILYLPVLAFWAALASWLLGGHQGRDGTVRLWYIAAGSAFFLNQYPRMDTIHLLWSAGPLLVAGADVLYRLYRGAIAGAPALRRYQSARRALAVAIVAIPLIACLPHFYWRMLSWSALSPAQGGEVHAAGTRAQERLAPLDLPHGGRVWMREAEAEPVQEVVDLLMARTAPGEPVFTYPAIPGFAYLADRPAATRYLHLFPGMAPAARAGEPGAAAGRGALRGVGRRRGPLLGAPGGQRPRHGVRPHPLPGGAIHRPLRRPLPGRHRALPPLHHPHRARGELGGV